MSPQEKQMALDSIRSAQASLTELQAVIKQIASNPHLQVLLRADVYHPDGKKLIQKMHGNAAKIKAKLNTYKF